MTNLVDQTDGETTTIRELLKTFGTRSFGPMLFLPSIIALGPTGAIPGMSIVTGALILIIAVQMLIGREQVWLPERALRFEVSRNRLKQLADKVVPWTDWLERFVGTRATVLVSAPWNRAIAAVSAVLALTMFPLALLPFAVAVPASALTLFSLGLLLRDGVLIAVGYVLAAAAAFLLLWII